MGKNELDRFRTLISAALEPAISEGEMPVRLGQYQLLSEIGRGGLGAVYRALQPELNREVAVKVILDDRLDGPAAIDRFRRESKAMAHSDHPNILGIYEVGQCEGFFYFSMPLVHGGSMADQFAKLASPQEGESARTKEQRLAGIVEAIARAVHHGHQRGILHLDLKPANILIHSDGHPVVADFGLARLITQDDDAPSGGTADWMAPEQETGSEVSTAADVYAIGKILYALLRGGGTKATNHPAPEHPDFAANCSPQMREILRCCLQPDPLRRYASARDLADDLCRLREHRPLRCAEPGLLLRTRLWMRRNPGSARLVGLLAACLMLALALGWRSWMADLRHHRFVQAEEYNARLELAKQLMQQADQRNREGFWGEAASLRGEALKQLPAGADTEAIYRRVHQAWQKTEPFRITFDEAVRVHIVSNGQNRVAAFADGLREWKTTELLGQEWTTVRTHQLHEPPLEAVFAQDSSHLWIVTAGSLNVIDYLSGKPVFEAPRSDHWRFPIDQTWQTSTRLIPLSTDRMIEIGQSYRIWNSTTFELVAEGPIPLLEKQEMAGVWKLDYHVEAGLIALAVQKGGAALWDVAHERWRQLGSGQSRVVRFSPDGNLLAVGEESGKVLLYDTATGELAGYCAHDGRIESLDFSPDNLRLVSSSRDRTAQVWDLPIARNPQPVYILQHPSAVLNTLFLSEDELFTSSEDQVLRHYELKNGALIQPMPGGQAQGCDLGHLRNGEDDWMVLDQTLGDARFYLLDNESLGTVPVPGQIAELTYHGDRLFGLIHHPELLVLEGNVENPEVIASVARPLTSLWATAMDREQSLVAFGHPMGKVSLVDRRGRIEELALPSTFSIAHLDLSARHDRLIATSTDSQLFSVDLRDPGKTRSVPLPWFANSIALHPSGEFFAIADRLGFIELRECETLERIARTESPAHRNLVLALEFSQDGRRLASGGMDKTARVWQVPELRPVSPPLPHLDYVWELAFWAEDQELLTGGQERLIRRWDLSTGLLLAPPATLEDWPNAFSVDRDKGILHVATSAHTITSLRLDEAVSPR